MADSVSVYVFKSVCEVCEQMLTKLLTPVNPPCINCVILVLGTKRHIFKEGSTLYKGARVSKAVRVGVKNNPFQMTCLYAQRKQIYIDFLVTDVVELTIAYFCCCRERNQSQT